MNLEDKIVASPIAIHTTPLYVGFTRKPGNGKISQKFSRILKEFKDSEECEEIMKTNQNSKGNAIPLQLILPAEIKHDWMSTKPIHRNRSAICQIRT